MRPSGPLLTLAVLTVALAGIAEPVRAQAPVRHTKVSLVAETDAVQPGRALHLAIRLQMEPGWHTYWRNPGDAGLPTRVKWTLPSGFEAGEVRWPYPERFTQGPVGSYGYAHEVLLLDEVRVPASLPDAQVRLAAHVDWLECQEACLPGKADVSLALPVRATARPGPEARAFAETRDRLPVSHPAWRFSATSTQGAVTLAVTPPRGTTVKGASFFPLTPRLVDYGSPQRLERTAGGFRLLLPRDPNGSPAEHLAGVLVAQGPSGTRALEVDLALAR
ncbi:MAG TPA: protein-disulfide reductase DsbD domain-containing protein [Vicinamibacteria bacterium]|nr:protein-disulfide reductase DsbD domain-containing protein [Vicinamibacteria bacterium]